MRHILYGEIWDYKMLAEFLFTSYERSQKFNSIISLKIRIMKKIIHNIINIIYVFQSSNPFKIISNSPTIKIIKIWKGVYMLIVIRTIKLNIAFKSKNPNAIIKSFIFIFPKYELKLSRYFFPL